jgi:LSD1 subclass zinc finger protein
VAEDDRRCRGGLHDGQGIPGHALEDLRDTDGDLPPWCWIGPSADVHREAAEGRTLYWIGDETLDFGGYGMAECGGCHSVLDPLPGGQRRVQCQLCGGAVQRT